jgi:hypothetical protein
MRTVQRGNENVPHVRPDPPGYKVSLFCLLSGRVRLPRKGR